MIYRATVWCLQCQDDPLGCEDLSEDFKTQREAIEWGENEIADCSPWRYEVEEVKS